MFFQSAPVKPSHRIILTIDVVVPFLRIAEFVPGQDARCSLRKQQQEECISCLILPKLCYRLLPGRPFRPAVPAVVIIRSVLVLLSIGFIMLTVIRDKIPQGKPGLPGDHIQNLFCF